MKVLALSHVQYLSVAFFVAILCLAGGPSVGAQIVIGQPVIEIDKKIVTYDDTGGEVEMNDLGEVLVGTPIFFKYRVSYTGYITGTVPVTVTTPFTDTFPVGIDFLAIRDDMGSLNPEDAFNCILTTLPITGTIPVTTPIPVSTTPSITTTLPIGGTVIFTDTIPFLPGDVFECVSSSGIVSPTETVFTPRSDGGYVNTAVATIGPCVDDCEPSDSDTASYVGLYWAFGHGFWKNHTGDRRSRGQDAWAYTAYSPGMLLGSVFQAPNALSGKTLLEALQFKGGKGPDGAARILLRAGVAALLNASFHETMNSPLADSYGELLLPDGRTLFPYGSQKIQEMVDDLLAIENREAMLLIAEQLDDFNDGIHYIDWNWVPPVP